MNNYCRNCGIKLTNFNICEKCGTKVLTKRLEEFNKSLAKKYIVIFFIMLGTCIISNILYIFTDFELSFPIIYILPLILIVFIMYAKETLKYSKFFNIIFWITISLFIMFILLILFTIISCEYHF